MGLYSGGLIGGSLRYLLKPYIKEKTKTNRNKKKKSKKSKVEYKRFIEI